jgi:hypothetical protein
MWTLGPLGFTAPWLLLALVALPILWLILRAVPPSPIRRRFPGVALLLGLDDREHQSDRTPWWLLLLRILAVAAVILGFAGPILNPREEGGGSGPLLVALDGTWADARDWAARLDRAEALLGEAARDGRTAARGRLTAAPGTPEFRDAEAAIQALRTSSPQPWLPRRGDAAWAEALRAVEGGFDTSGCRTGSPRGARGAPAGDGGQGRRHRRAGAPPGRGAAARALRGGRSCSRPRRTPTGPAAEVPVAAVGLDPAGTERQLATATLAFEAGAGEAEVALDLPPSCATASRASSCRACARPPP